MLREPRGIEDWQPRIRPRRRRSPTCSPARGGSLGDNRAWEQIDGGADAIAADLSRVGSAAARPDASPPADAAASKLEAAA